KLAACCCTVNCRPALRTPEYTPRCGKLVHGESGRAAERRAQTTDTGTSADTQGCPSAGRGAQNRGATAKYSAGEIVKKCARRRARQHHGAGSETCCRQRATAGRLHDDRIGPAAAARSEDAGTVVGARKKA